MHAPIKVRGEPLAQLLLQSGERRKERERGGRGTREREGRQGEEKSSFELVSITWVCHGIPN